MWDKDTPIPDHPKINYFESVAGMIEVESMMVLFRFETIMGAAIAIGVCSIYFLPLLLLLLFSLKKIFKLVTTPIYASIGRTKENRWKCNSWATLLFCFPATMLFGSTVFLVLVMAVSPVWFFVGYFLGVDNPNMLSQIFVFDGSTLSSFIFTFLVYADGHPIISMVRWMVCIPFIFNTYYAHHLVTLQEFVENNGDTRLIWE